MKKYIFILIAVVQGITACNNDEKVLPNSKKVSSSAIALCVPNRILSDEQIDSIAIFHNLFLTEVANNYNFNSSNYDDEMYRQFESIGLNDFNMSSQEIASYLDSCDNYNYAFIASHSDDPDVIIILNNINSYITSNPNCTFSEVQSQVSIQTTYAQNYLVGSDLDVALVFLQTFEKSSYFWMPQNKGGSGIGSGFIDDFEDELPGVSINWGAIAYADGAGAAGVLLRTWYLATAPLTWGAILGAIGWGAAWASGTGLLYQLM